MARLRMRLIRIGDRDGLGTSEATRTRGGPSVRGSRSAHRHDLAGREIVGIRNWVLGTEWGILCRTRFRVYRRDDQGRLSLVLATNQDRVESVQLRCHLRAVGSGADLRLRIATGPDGEELFATDSERARTEAERARMAEQEIARLRAELEALRCQLDQLGYAGHFT